MRGLGTAIGLFALFAVFGYVAATIFLNPDSVSTNSRPGDARRIDSIISRAGGDHVCDNPVPGTPNRVDQSLFISVSREAIDEIDEDIQGLGYTQVNSDIENDSSSPWFTYEKDENQLTLTVSQETSVADIICRDDSGFDGELTIEDNTFVVTFALVTPSD